MDFILPDANPEFSNLISGFEIPLDIQNDIVYCQRSIRLYLRALQNLLASNSNCGTLHQLTKCMIELESEISDISTEQKFSILCLRVRLSDYYAKLRENNVEVDTEFGNRYISELLNECINDEDFECRPTNVKVRLNADELREKYKVSEVVQQAAYEPKLNRVVNAGESLLISKQKDIQPTNVSSAAVNIPEIVHENSLADNSTVTLDINKPDQSDEPISSFGFSSPAIIRSRFNLREALKKAESFRNMKRKSRAKTSKEVPLPSTSPLSSSSASSSAFSTPSSPAKASKKNRSDTSPCKSDEPTHPSQLSQERFLQIFGLYNWEYLNFIGQRRSMRRRRTVKNNEKSDFHYYKAAEAQESNKTEKDKKKKMWTASAPGGKGRKRKAEPVAGCSKAKKGKIEKPKENVLRCNECSEAKRGGEHLVHCQKCTSLFHVSCHSAAISKVSNTQRGKYCPSCFRKITTSIPGFKMRYGKNIVKKNKKKPLIVYTARI